MFKIFGTKDFEVSAVIFFISPAVHSLIREDVHLVDQICLQVLLLVY